MERSPYTAPIALLAFVTIMQLVTSAIIYLRKFVSEPFATSIFRVTLWLCDLIPVRSWWGAEQAVSRTMSAIQGYNINLARGVAGLPACDVAAPFRTPPSGTEATASRRPFKEAKFACCSCGGLQANEHLAKGAIHSAPAPVIALLRIGEASLHRLARPRRQAGSAAVPIRLLVATNMNSPQIAVELPDNIQKVAQFLPRTCVAPGNKSGWGFAVADAALMCARIALVSQLGGALFARF